MLTIKWRNGKLNEQGTWKKVFKEMFDWNYWMTYMHALLILSTFHDKLHRLLFIFLLNVNSIWKLLRTVYQKMFLTKCHTRAHYIYIEVSLLWSQGKIKGNTRFSRWMFKRVCAQRKVSHPTSLDLQRGCTIIDIWNLDCTLKGVCLIVDWRDFPCDR